MRNILTLLNNILLLTAVLVMAARPGIARAEYELPGPFEEPAILSEHAIRVGGEELRYVAEVGRIAIRDAETGEPRGYMFYIAYRVPSDTARPLAFVWNGGPGANSALLHFEAAGPRRLENDRLVDNDDTWLTDMDLVFVDPIGTGFSRPAKSEYADEFYGTIGDVASVTEFVRAWRLLHSVEDAPLLLIGESWGAGRAGSVGYALLKRGVTVDALVLISGGTGLADNPVPRALQRALRVADLSTTALHHGRLDPALGDSAAAIRAEAENWARQTYAPALEHTDTLSDAERDDIVAGLERYTGVPAALIDRASLRIPPRPYRENLLQASGRQLYLFDMRQIAEETPPDASDSGPPRDYTIPRYLRHELGYRTTLPYLSAEPIQDVYSPSGEFPAPVGARWNYATAELTPEEIQAAYELAMRLGDGPPRMGPPLPSAAEAVALNPQLKVLVAAGRFDSMNSCTANAEIGRQLQAPLREAYEFACFEGGHMMYEDVPARVELTRQVRALARAVRTAD